MFFYFRTDILGVAPPACRTVKERFFSEDGYFIRARPTEVSDGCVVAGAAGESLGAFGAESAELLGEYCGVFGAELSGHRFTMPLS